MTTGSLAFFRRKGADVMQSRKVGVLLGGLSSEREQSIKTGEGVSAYSAMR